MSDCCNHNIESEPSSGSLYPVDHSSFPTLASPTKAPRRLLCLVLNTMFISHIQGSYMAPAVTRDYHDALTGRSDVKSAVASLFGGLLYDDLVIIPPTLCCWLLALPGRFWPLRAESSRRVPAECGILGSSHVSVIIDAAALKRTLPVNLAPVENVPLTTQNLHSMLRNWPNFRDGYSRILLR